MIITIIIWIVFTSGPTSPPLTGAAAIGTRSLPSSSSFLYPSPFSSASLSPSSLSFSLPELFSPSGDSVGVIGRGRETSKTKTPTMDSLLGTMMEMASGGYTLLLVPPAMGSNISKRDPMDVGAGRGYTGSSVINSVRGLTASSDPIGPGKRSWKKMRVDVPNNPVLSNGDY